MTSDAGRQIEVDDERGEIKRGMAKETLKEECPQSKVKRE